MAVFSNGDFDANDISDNDFYTNSAPSTFDPTFDNTFTTGFVFTPTATQAGCRSDGIYLRWLALRGGWVQWLFEGAYTQGVNVTATGTAKKAGLDNPILLEAGDVYTLFTANLNKAEAALLATIHSSVSIYMVDHKADNSLKFYRVQKPVANAETWNNRNFVNSFSIQIQLPTLRSQRF